MKQVADWIAVDWGNSNLRLWVMDAGGILAERRADKGILTLSGPQDFEPILLELVEEFLAEDRVTPVLICGAAGAQGGWQMAPYRAVPCTPLDASSAIFPPVTNRRLQVYILPGLSQANPPAVLRGEETQIAGFLTQEPEFDGVLCLPGTHTMWAHISAGEVVSFMPFMTGELFALLVGQSVLRLTLTESGFDEGEFLEAVSTAISRLARSRLLGLLIGAELAAAKMHWLGREVVVIGGAASTESYLTALRAQGVAARGYDADSAVLAGLTQAYNVLR
ncbi:MAG: 2-dehydro-3-deoxygalactonokinase [Maritimibacter sp.]